MFTNPLFLDALQTSGFAGPGLTNGPNASRESLLLLKASRFSMHSDVLISAAVGASGQIDGQVA